MKARDDLKSGEYQFARQASLGDVIGTIIEGRVVQHQLTLPEGLTSEQIVQRLLESDILAGNVREIPREGSILPETYKFTRGTARELTAAGIDAKVVKKVMEGRPHIVDAMKSGEVQLVFNTTGGAQAAADSFALRRTALLDRIPYYTTVAGARAAVEAIAALRSGNLDVAPLQSYFKTVF